MASATSSSRKAKLTIKSIADIAANPLNKSTHPVMSRCFVLGNVPIKGGKKDAQKNNSRSAYGIYRHYSSLCRLDTVAGAGESDSQYSKNNAPWRK